MASLAQYLHAPDTQRHKKPTHIALWVLAVVIALNLMAASFAKFAGADAQVDMFDELGAGQWFRYLIASFELAGAVGLLVPRVRGLAAACLSVMFVGIAIASATALDESPVIPLMMVIATGVIAYARRRETAAMMQPVTPTPM